MMFLLRGRYGKGGTGLVAQIKPGNGEHDQGQRQGKGHPLGKAYPGARHAFEKASQNCIGWGTNQGRHSSNGGRPGNRQHQTGCKTAIGHPLLLLLIGDHREGDG